MVRLGRNIERLFPAILSFIFVIVISFVPIHSITNMKDIVISIITFASILIGFLTTMLSVLITAIDNSIIKYIKKKNRIKDLYYFIAEPIIIGFILIIICLMFIPISDVNNLKDYPNYYFLGLFFMYFILSCIRSIGILILLIFQFIDEDKFINKQDDDLDLSNAFRKNKKQ